VWVGVWVWVWVRRGCVWFGLVWVGLGWISTTTTSLDEPGRALTAALPLPLVLVLCSCSARACALVRERVPVAEGVRSCLLNLRCIPSASNLAALSSQLSSCTSELSSRTSLSLRSHAKSLDDGGGARCAACNDEICFCTTVVQGPLSPTVYRLAMCCGRHRARRRYQVSCSTREMQMLVREGLAAIRRNRAAFGFGGLPAVCLLHGGGIPAQAPGDAFGMRTVLQTLRNNGRNDDGRDVGRIAPFRLSLYLILVVHDL
jgi:hypothetical protein